MSQGGFHIDTAQARGHSNSSGYTQLDSADVSAVGTGRSQYRDSPAAVTPRGPSGIPSSAAAAASNGLSPAPVNVNNTSSVSNNINGHNSSQSNRNSTGSRASAATSTSSRQPGGGGVSTGGVTVEEIEPLGLELQRLVEKARLHEQMSEEQRREMRGSDHNNNNDDDDEDIEFTEEENDDEDAQPVALATIAGATPKRDGERSSSQASSTSTSPELKAARRQKMLHWTMASFAATMVTPFAVQAFFNLLRGGSGIAGGKNVAGGDDSAKNNWFLWFKVSVLRIGHPTAAMLRDATMGSSMPPADYIGYPITPPWMTDKMTWVPRTRSCIWDSVKSVFGIRSLESFVQASMSGGSLFAAEGGGLTFPFVLPVFSLAYVFIGAWAARVRTEAEKTTNDCQQKKKSASNGEECCSSSSSSNNNDDDVEMIDDEDYVEEDSEQEELPSPASPVSVEGPRATSESVGAGGSQQRFIGSSPSPSLDRDVSPSYASSQPTHGRPTAELVADDTNSPLLHQSPGVNSSNNNNNNNGGGGGGGGDRQHYPPHAQLTSQEMMRYYRQTNKGGAANPYVVKTGATTQTTEVRTSTTAVGGESMTTPCRPDSRSSSQGSGSCAGGYLQQHVTAQRGHVTLALFSPCTTFDLNSLTNAAMKYPVKEVIVQAPHSGSLNASADIHSSSLYGSPDSSGYGETSSPPRRGHAVEGGTTGSGVSTTGIYVDPNGSGSNGDLLSGSGGEHEQQIVVKYVKGVRVVQVPDVERTIRNLQESYLRESSEGKPLPTIAVHKAATSLGAELHSFSHPGDAIYVFTKTLPPTEPSSPRSELSAVYAQEEHDLSWCDSHVFLSADQSYNSLAALVNISLYDRQTKLKKFESYNSARVNNNGAPLFN